MTIVVALITSLSTLAGGLIASLISLRVQDKQIALQATLASEERDANRYERQMEARKQACLEFLNKVADIEELLHKCWWEETAQGKEGTLTETFVRVMALTLNLGRSINQVAIEGPVEVAVSADELQRALMKEVEAALDAAYGSPEDQNGKMLLSVDRNKHGKALSRRERAKINFIESMQEQSDEQAIAEGQ